MINKVILIGNVGQDPEIRYVGDPSSTTKVATIRLATSERYKDRSGVLQEHTEWHSVVAWRGTADVVEKYVKKGTQIYVEGRLRTRSWDDQGGNKRYSTEILADTLQLLGRRSDNPGSGAYQQSAGSGAYQPSQPQAQYQQPQAPYSQPAGFQPSSAPYGQPQPQYQQPAGFQPAAAPAVSNEPEDDLPF